MRPLLLFFVLALLGCESSPSSSSGETKSGSKEVKAEPKKDAYPLHTAAQTGTVEEVQGLLKGGADVNALDEASATALHHAAYRCRIDVVKALLEAKPNLELRSKPQDDTVPPLAMFRKFHKRISARMRGPAFADESYGTAPEEASGEVVKALLDAGADPKALGRTGMTPLHVAALTHDLPALDLLLARKVDVNAKSKTVLRTPLHLAAESGGVDTVERLLAKGADAHAPDHTNSTPIHAAIRAGHKPVLRVLLEKGDKAGLNGQRNPPLRYAAILSDLEIVRMLIDAGSDVNERSEAEGNMALKWARKKNKKDVEALLLERGAKE